MALKFTVESFLNLVRQSRLIDTDRLQQLVAALPADGDSQSVAEALVSSGALTDWQADKLLKGKHKGFFLGKYRLQSLLGKGGMSSVYLAEHVLMRRRCAIKVLPHKKVNDTSYLERFHREAQAVASLDHPNIVRAYDVDREVDGKTEIHFLVMEYVEGHSLQDLVVDDGPRGFREAADFIRQSAHGLTHAHGAGLVHRDIKPGNLLVDTEGVVKILDLGLARFFEEEDENPITLRHDERVLGTADYLAPEQALDSHKADARADIYSLGCTMYFLLTGRPPFNEGTLAQRLMWHQTREPPALAEIRSDVPGPLAEIVSRMMTKDPDARYQTADQVAEQLTAWLGDGEPTDSQAPVAQAVPVAKPVAAVAAVAPQVPPAAPVATPVEPPTPVIDEVLAAAATDTAEIVASETKPIVAAADDSGVLASFLSSLGESPSVSPPAASDAVAEAEVPPLVAAVEAPAPAPPPATLVEVTRPEVESAPGLIPVAEGHDGGFPMLDTSAPASTPRPRTRDRTASKRDGGSRRGLMIGLAAGGLVLIVVIALAISGSLGGGDDTGEEKGGGSGGGATTDGGSGGGTGGDESGGDESGGGDVQMPPAKKAAKAKKTLQVGPDADFKTIGAALAYVRTNKDGYAKASRRIQVTIEVLGGQTYAESIEIDNKEQQWPTGIAIIGTGINPVIAPPGQKPGIRLNDVNHIRIKGFQIDVKGKPTGVVLSGGLGGVQLEDLAIDGFTETGIDLLGAVGDPSVDALRLTGLRLTSGGAEAVGMKLSRKGVDDTAHVEITGCRLIGPQRAGIELTDNATYLALRESVIGPAGVAILFSGENRRWKNVSIRNNTFFKVGRGLVFEHMPVDDSDNVTIRRNLFFEVMGPECLVENKYVESQFLQMVNTSGAISENWSTRTEAADREKSEHELMLPGLARQRGVKVEFSSTDPLVDDFLEPRAGTLPRHGRGNPKDPVFIGAQPFRQR